MTKMAPQKTRQEHVECALSVTQNGTAAIGAAVSDKYRTEKDASMTSLELEKEPHSTVIGIDDDLWSVYSTRGKRLLIFSASCATLLAPLSSQIYFPALEPIAKDLQVSPTLVNLSISSFMILQGISPIISAQLSDTIGRRPVLLVCSVIYLAANIGLGVQNSFPALLTLRCFQSAGSSGIALSTAIAADIATPAERGSFVAYSSALPMLATSLVSILYAAPCVA
jgi:hypothetical protein